MPSRRNSKADRERRRDDAFAREINRAGRSPQDQFKMLERAPGRSVREMRKLSKENETALAGHITKPDPDNAYRMKVGKPNHFYHDALGDPATCTGDHNHPAPEPMHLPDPPHVSG